MKSEHDIQLEVEKLCRQIEVLHGHMDTGKGRDTNSFQFNCAKERLRAFLWVLEGKYMTQRIRDLLK